MYSQLNLHVENRFALTKLTMYFVGGLSREALLANPPDPVSEIPRHITAVVSFDFSNDTTIRMNYTTRFCP